MPGGHVGQFPGTRGTDSCELLCGCLESSTPANEASDLNCCGAIFPGLGLIFFLMQSFDLGF